MIDVDELLAPLRDPAILEIPPVTDVARRARRVRRRRYARRSVIAALVVLTIAVPASLVATRRPGRVATDRRSTTTTSPSSRAPRNVALPPFTKLRGTPFTPPVVREGSTTVLSLTFLDGQTVELRYPNTVDLAGLVPTWAAEAGLPSGNAGVPNGAELAVVHGTPAQVFAGRQPDRTYANGAVEYDASAGGYLAVPIHDWTVVAVTTSLGDAERALLANALSGRVDRDAYLVLTPRSPVTLLPLDRPEISLGDEVGLLRRPCDPLTGRHTAGGLAIERGTETGTSGTWLCAEARNLVIHLNGRAEQIADRLQVR